MQKGVKNLLFLKDIVAQSNLTWTWVGVTPFDKINARSYTKFSIVLRWRIVATSCPCLLSETTRFGALCELRPRGPLAVN